MRRLTLFAIAIALPMANHVNAQGRPDFSGTWSGSDTCLTIKQDAATLTVNTDSWTRTYNLDGSDSRFEKKTDRNTTSQLTAQARWVGSALVITTTTISSIGSWQDLEVYSLDYGPKLNIVRVDTQTTRPWMNTTTATFTRPPSGSRCR